MSVRTSTGETSKMDYFEVVKSRRSVRAFQTQPVEEEKIRRIIETVNLAPSAGDLQAYKIVVVKDPKRRNALAKAAWDQGFIAEAPVSLVFLAHPERSSRKYGQRGSELYCLQDAAIAASYAQLAATALGLASTWVGAFDDESVAKTVEATGTERPVAILPIGYAAETPDITPRRAIDEILCSETSRSPYPFSFTDQSYQRPVWKPRP
jgi:nitroreductase